MLGNFQSVFFRWRLLYSEFYYLLHRENLQGKARPSFEQLKLEGVQVFALWIRSYPVFICVFRMEIVRNQSDITRTPWFLPKQHGCVFVFTWTFGTRIGFYGKTAYLGGKSFFRIPPPRLSWPNAKTNYYSTDIVVGGGGKCGGEQATIDEVLPNNHVLINTVNHTPPKRVLKPPGDDCEYSASKEAKMPSTFTLMALLPCLAGKTWRHNDAWKSPSWREITIFPLKNWLVTLFILKGYVKNADFWRIFLSSETHGTIGLKDQSALKKNTSTAKWEVYQILCRYRVINIALIGAISPVTHSFSAT